MFHIYYTKFISVTSHALDPHHPCHKLSHFLGPLERDVLYGRPLTGKRYQNDINGFGYQRTVADKYSMLLLTLSTFKTFSTYTLYIRHVEHL